MRPLDITATVNTSLTPTLDHAAVTTLASRIAKWSWTIRGLVVRHVSTLGLSGS